MDEMVKLTTVEEAAALIELLGDVARPAARRRWSRIYARLIEAQAEVEGPIVE